MCKNAPYLTFVSRSSQHAFHFQPDCLNWACKECRPRMEARWNSHAANIFHACPAGIGYFSVTKADWKRVRARLLTAEAEYIRVRAPGNVFHVFTSRPEVGTQRRLTPDQAENRFAGILAAAPGDQGHVISTSRKWKALDRKQLRTIDESGTTDFTWIATGVSPKHFQRVASALQQPVYRAADALECHFSAPETLETFVAAIRRAVNLHPTRKETYGNSPEPLDPGQHDAAQWRTRGEPESKSLLASSG